MREKHERLSIGCSLASSCVDRALAGKAKAWYAEVSKTISIPYRSQLRDAETDRIKKRTV